ncbi:hypothetical protein conserved [Entamoeba histolytica]|nr:hypothetical protein conserved [Entamoeba histolytica]
MYNEKMLLNFVLFKKKNWKIVICIITTMNKQEPFIYKMKVVDLINDKKEDEMIQLIVQAMKKLHDPLEEKYITKRDEMIQSLKQLDGLLVSEEIAQKRVPLMTIKQVEDKEKELNSFQIEEKKTEKIKEEIKTKEEQLLKMKKEVNEKQIKCEELSKQQQEQQNTIKLIKNYTLDDINKKKLEQDAKEVELVEVKKKVKETKASLEQKKQENQKLKNERDELLKKIEEIETINTNGETKIKELEDEIKKLNDFIQTRKRELEMEATALERKGRDLEKEIDEIQKHIIESCNALGIDVSPLEIENNLDYQQVNDIESPIDDDGLLF